MVALPFGGEVSPRIVAAILPGSAILLEDTVGKGHRSRVIGNSEVVLAVVHV
jgi:hypothetical protein